MKPRLTAARQISLWAPILLWAALIYWLSSIPYLRITQAWWDIIVRKIAHLGEYAILARLFSRAFIGSTFWPWKKIFAVSLFSVLIYASTDEYHQTFVPGRVGCVHDVIIDLSGAWVGMGLWP